MLCLIKTANRIFFTWKNNVVVRTLSNWKNECLTLKNYTVWNKIIETKNTHKRCTRVPYNFLPLTLSTRSPTLVPPLSPHHWLEHTRTHGPTHAPLRRVEVLSISPLLCATTPSDRRSLGGSTVREDIDCRRPGVDQLLQGLALTHPNRFCPIICGHMYTTAVVI